MARRKPTFNGLEVAVESLTPGDCETILEISEGVNWRHRAPKIVSRYAQLLKKGAWDVNGESIILDKAGKCVDGQHRLAAAVEAGVPITSVVVRGVDPKAGRNIDTGRKRTVAGLLAKQGESDCHKLAAALRTLWFWRTFDSLDQWSLRHGGVAPSHGELITLLSANSQIREHVKAVGHWHRFGPVGIQAVLRYIATQKLGEEIPNTFFTKLWEGADIHHNDPIFRLRKRLETDRKQGDRGKRLRPRERAALLIKCWNFWLEGRETTVLLFRDQGKGAEVFPKPHFDYLREE